MRTTINLDDALLRETKMMAAASGKTFTKIVEDSLRETLARRKSGGTRRAIKLHTFKGSGTRPGVDINDSASLLDLMEEDDARRRR